MTLYGLKALLGAGSAVATGLTSYSYAAPFIERAFGRTAVVATAETLSSRAAAVVATRIIFMSAGMWVTAGIFTVQVIIFLVKDDALQGWLSLTPFGVDNDADAAYQGAEAMEVALANAWEDVS
jgi:hypothetical protein